MTAATELWAAVVVSYESTGLISLTNIRDNNADSITTATGEDAAQGVINLWPAYTGSDYDSTKAIDVEVGKRGVIAMLWERGGTSSTIPTVEWDEVFGDDGLLEKLKRVAARGRAGPSSNSGVTQKAETTVNGGRIRSWSDRESYPPGFLISRKSAAED